MTRLLQFLSGTLAVGGLGLVLVGVLDLADHQNGAAGTAFVLGVICLVAAPRFFVASRRTVGSTSTSSEDLPLPERGSQRWKLTWTIFAGAVGASVGYAVGHDLTGVIVGAVLAMTLVAVAAFGPMPSGLSTGKGKGG